MFNTNLAGLPISTMNGRKLANTTHVLQIKHNYLIHANFKCDKHIKITLITFCEYF